MIFCDLNVPDAQGEETIKLVSEMFQLVPIIVFSGIDDPSLIKESAKSDILDFLSKDELKNLSIDKKISFLLNKHSYLREEKLRNELQLFKVIAAESSHQLNNSMCKLSLLDSSLNNIPVEIEEKIKRVVDSVKRHTLNMLFMSQDCKLEMDSVTAAHFINKLKIEMDTSKLINEYLIIDIEKIELAYFQFLEDLSIDKIEVTIVNKSIKILISYNSIINVYKFDDTVFSEKVLEGIILMQDGTFVKNDKSIIFSLPFVPKI